MLKLRSVSILLVATLSAACSADHASSDATDARADEIVNGTPATAYPEAATLDIDMGPNGGWACSAAVIAPRVVLTAGHCVDGHSKWDVRVGKEARTSLSALTYDWHENGAQIVNPAHHDIGLVFLDAPIALATFPTLAKSRLANGSRVQNVGRINNGVLTSTLFAAESVVTDGAAMGYPLDYASSLVIQHGDSGGPDFLSGTHMIAAVNSGAGTTSEVLARVDLVFDWIQAQIAAHPVGAPPPPDLACAGASEAEPNDAFPSATVLGTTPLCGALASPTDEDWYSVAFGPGAVSVELSGAGDAELSVGQVEGAACLPALTGVRKVAMTATAAKRLCVRVASPTHTRQKYSLVRH